MPMMASKGKYLHVRSWSVYGPECTFCCGFVVLVVTLHINIYRVIVYRYIIFQSTPSSLTHSLQTINQTL